MLNLPSMPNIILSTIAFFVALWYFHRRLDESDIPKGMTRSILVFTLATVVSFGVGAAVDWVFNKGSGAPQAAHAGVTQQPMVGSDGQE